MKKLRSWFEVVFYTAPLEVTSESLKAVIDLSLKEVTYSAQSRKQV